MFPNAGLTLATIEIAGALDSFAFRVLGSVMVCFLVGAWVGVAVACGRAVWRREVL